MSTPPSNGDSRLADAAERQVNRLIKAKAAPRWLPQLLAVIMTILVAGSIVLGVVVKKVADQQTAQQQGAIASCLAGNHARATNVKIWDGFLTLLIDNPNTPKIEARLISSIAALHLPPAQEQAFDVLIRTAYATNPDSVATVKKFEAFIAANEPQQKCLVIYSSHAAAMRIPARG